MTYSLSDNGSDSPYGMTVTLDGAEFPNDQAASDFAAGVVALIMQYSTIAPTAQYSMLRMEQVQTQVYPPVE